MKKIIILLSVALAALAVSCNKVTPQDSTPDAPKGEKITITVSLSDALSKVSLTQDSEDPDGAIKVAWEATDKIFVIDASNPNNFEAFSIVAGSIDTEKPYTATFEGTAPDASSFNILYGATSVSAANSFNSEQSQTGNASTDHLQYKALISGVSSIENIEFSKTWAETNGGSFSQNGALRLRIQVPAEVTSVASVSLKAPSAIFSGSETITIKFNASVEPVNGIITAYAMLPMGDAIEVAEGNFEVTIATAEENEYYKTFSPGAISFKPGQTNAIKLNKSGFSNNLFAGGTGIEGDPYLIATAKHMQNMHIVMKDNAVIYFKMIDDIDMTDVEWVSLNNSGSFSKGINFDGDNHTISNLTVGDGSAYPSFVGVLNGTIKNVTFDTGTITANSNTAGVLAGYIGSSSANPTVSGNISGITIKNYTVTGSKQRLGGIAGYANVVTGDITDCHVFDTTVSSSADRVGGLFGQVDKNITLSECSSDGVIVSGSLNIGGLVGVNYGAITGSSSKATVSSTNTDASKIINVGGFVGYHTGSITNSTATCSIGQDTAQTGVYVGGFVGQIIESGIIQESEAEGSISVNGSSTKGTTGNAGGSYAGGFVGCLVKGTVIGCSANVSVTANGHYNGGFCGKLGGGGIEKSCAKGTINGSAQNNGGFIGWIGTSEAVSVTNCYSSGNNTSTNQREGGFIGLIESNYMVTISNCYATGTVSGSFGIGGFVARISNANCKIENCAAWHSSVNPTTYGSVNWSSGAVVGVAFPTCTLTDNYRNPSMSLTAYWVPDSDYQHANVSSAHPLVKQNGSETTATSLSQGQDGYPQFPYHGKVDSGKTLSKLASTTLGWSSEVWDFTGDLPTLK